MATSTVEAAKPAAVDWRKVHALGLPAGSVRALLALMLFATVWALMLLKPRWELPDYLRDLLFIILGHYFAARRRGPEPGEQPGPPPLFLPKGTVRLVIVAGFAAVAALLYRRGQLAAHGGNPAFVTLVLVGGFVLGVLMAQVWAWVRGRGVRTPRALEDVRAVVALAAAVVLIVLVWNRFLPELSPPRVGALGVPRPRVGGFELEQVLAGVIGFYFGSRS